jgi:hypothetical protein
MSFIPWSVQRILFVSISKNHIIEKLIKVQPQSTIPTQKTAKKSSFEQALFICFHVSFNSTTEKKTTNVIEKSINN